MSKRAAIADIESNHGVIRGVIAPDNSVYDAEPVIIETTIAPNDLMATDHTAPDGTAYRKRVYSPAKHLHNDHIGHYYTIAFQLI